MQMLSDDELHQIVERTLQNVLSGVKLPNSPAMSEPKTQPVQDQPVAPVIKPDPTKRVVAIGTDHGGVELKEIIKADLLDQGYQVLDCGTNTKDAVDYPDIALAVAKLVVSGVAWRGIVIDGAGIGSCMCTNKVPGIRAAMCYDYATAVNSREHNDANVLTLGAGLIGVNLAKQIVKVWLTTEFGGGRHAKRVEKIIAIEKSYAKEAKS
jgi:ribose 5-phosphate isomerase B